MLVLARPRIFERRLLRRLRNSHPGAPIKIKTVMMAIKKSEITRAGKASCASCAGALTTFQRGAGGCPGAAQCHRARVVSRSKHGRNAFSRCLMRWTGEKSHPSVKN